MTGWLNSRPERCLWYGYDCASQLGLIRRQALAEIVDGFGAGGLFAIQSESSIGPPDCLLPVFDLMLTDRHLSVSLENWNLAELGELGLPDASISALVRPSRCRGQLMGEGGRAGATIHDRARSRYQGGWRVRERPARASTAELLPCLWGDR